MSKSSKTRRSRISGLLNNDAREHKTRDHELEDITESDSPARKRAGMKRYTVNFTNEENHTLRRFVLDAGGEVTIAQLFRHIVQKIETDADFAAELIADLAVQE